MEEFSREEEVSDSKVKESSLYVFNDDINTFKHVTKCLIDICELERSDAEEHTHSIHRHGFSVVVEGLNSELNMMCIGLTSFGIDAEVKEE